MATEAQLKAQKKYDRMHTQSFLFKLNQASDADIITRLGSVENRQGYVKKLIRRDIRGEGPVLSLDALKLLIRPVALKYHVSSVFLFGSYARGEAKESSDVDLLIHGGEIRSAQDYFSIVGKLEEVFGKKVDLVMADSVMHNTTRAGKRFLQHFERDKVLLYEKLP